jgi:hypothetical protein
VWQNSVEVIIVKKCIQYMIRVRHRSMCVRYVWNMMKCADSVYVYVMRKRRQVPTKSRSTNNTTGGGTYAREGGPTTSKTTDIISTFELRGRGEHINKTASDLHTISKIIHQLEGTTGRGKIWVI